MNDRLRERIHDPDPVLARAAELAAAVPPVATSDARKERVRKAVLAAPSRRLPWLLLRPSVALAVVLLAGVVMGATVGRAAIGRAFHRLIGEEPSSKHPAHVPAPTSLPSAPPAPMPEAPPPSVAPPATATVKPAHESPRAPRAPLRPTPEVRPPSEPQTPPAPAPVAKAPTAQESAVLMSAVRALRHEHDPARAAALLDDYLRRYPSGVLAEEALALSIEAASARGDGRAAPLARTYLQRYPQGRFAAAARAAAE